MRLGTARRVWRRGGQQPFSSQQHSKQKERNGSNDNSHSPSIVCGVSSLLCALLFSSVYGAVVCCVAVWWESSVCDCVCGLLLSVCCECCCHLCARLIRVSGQHTRRAEILASQSLALAESLLHSCFPLLCPVCSVSRSIVSCVHMCSVIGKRQSFCPWAALPSSMG